MKKLIIEFELNFPLRLANAQNQTFMQLVPIENWRTSASGWDSGQLTCLPTTYTAGAERWRSNVDIALEISEDAILSSWAGSIQSNI